MDSVLRESGTWPAAMAVSGGGDSLALMVLLAEWARDAVRERPAVLTVDHGLSPGSSRVAEGVAKQAGALGLEAHILVWSGGKPQSDIESAARTARYGLMGSWCRAQQVPALYVAHTLEDQAETFLLRLARGSGVDGLAAMARVSAFPVSGFAGIRTVRPLLAVPRARLRALLAGRNLDWHEDVMNRDPRFARARLRAAWPSLEAAGLTAIRVADAASHLARAREALDHDAAALLSEASRSHETCLLIDTGALRAAPREIGLRALARVLMQISGRNYRPRFERLEDLFEAIRSGALKGGRTLHGCLVKPAPKRQQYFGARTLLICREPGIDVEY